MNSPEKIEQRLLDIKKEKVLLGDLLENNKESDSVIEEHINLLSQETIKLTTLLESYFDEMIGI